MFEYSQMKKRKQRNEYSLATVYNPQGKLIHTLTHTGEREGGREGRAEGGRGGESEF